MSTMTSIERTRTALKKGKLDPACRYLNLSWILGWPTPPGTGGYMNPQFYPVMLLTE